MNTNQQIFSISDIAFNQSNMVLAIELVDIGIGTEIAVLGGHLGISHTLYKLVVLLAVILESLDRNELQIPFLGKLDKFRGAHHRAVIAHDLAAQAALLQAGKTHQVYRCLGVAVALKNTVGLCHQREHVARGTEILRTSILINALSSRVATLLSRNAGRGVNMIDRNSKCRFVIVGIGGYHLGEHELTAQIDAHGHADQALCVLRHEVHVFCRGEFCGTDEVTLVFAIRIIGAQDHLSLTKILQSLFNGAELEHYYPLMSPASQWGDAFS